MRRLSITTKYICYYTALILFMLLSLASCEKTESELESEEINDKTISFNFSFYEKKNNSTRVATSDEFKSSFENGDEIGVFAVRRPASLSGSLTASGNYINNIKLTYNNGTWSSEELLYYPPGTTDVLDFYFYYPYDASITDATAIGVKVNTDQSNLSDFSKSDLLLAAKSGVSRSDSPVQVIFSHAMALVTLTIQDKAVNVPQLDNTFSVKMKNVYTGGTIDWNTLKLNTDSTDMVNNIVMNKQTTSNGPHIAQYQAIVPAQAIEAGNVAFVFNQTTVGSEFNIPYAVSEKHIYNAGEVSQVSIEKLGWVLDPDHVYSVGDIYPYKGNPVGVVYSVGTDGKSGKVVYMKQTYGYWGTSGVTESNVLGTTITNGISGKAATRAIIEARKEQSNFASDYQLFNWIYNLNQNKIDGSWYLPTYSEMVDLRSNATLVNSMLTLIGGDQYLSSYNYWVAREATSTSVYTLSTTGTQQAMAKTNNFKFVAVTDIQQ